MDRIEVNPKSFLSNFWGSLHFPFLRIFLKSQGFIAEGGDGLAMGDEDHSLGGIGLEETGVKFAFGGGIE